MLGIFHAARDETGYVATRFLQMVTQHGGVEAAHQLLDSEAPVEGFTTLWEKGRLDLSVEALVLEPEFEELFSFDEREKARERPHVAGPPRSPRRRERRGWVGPRECPAAAS